MLPDYRGIHMLQGTLWGTGTHHRMIASIFPLGKGEIDIRSDDLMPGIA